MPTFFCTFIVGSNDENWKVENFFCCFCCWRTSILFWNWAYADFLPFQAVLCGKLMRCLLSSATSCFLLSCKSLHLMQFMRKEKDLRESYAVAGGLKMYRFMLIFFHNPQLITRLTFWKRFDSVRIFSTSPYWAELEHWP